MEQTIGLMQRAFFFLLLHFSVFSAVADVSQMPMHRRCIIIIDRDDFAENVGRSNRFYLMSKLQAAVEEHNTPILVTASLWNSFIERRLLFDQASGQTGSKQHSMLSMYREINERIVYWCNHYKQVSDDIIHIKELVVQRINQEFYDNDKQLLVMDDQYQLLLNSVTPFDCKQWHIYKNDGGFFLLLPDAYCKVLQSVADHKNHSDLVHGFKTSSLEEVECTEMAGNLYFDSRPLVSKSIVQNLSDFFVTHTDTGGATLPYTWTIALSGHGGLDYKEITKDGIIECYGEPLITDLPVEQFCSLLDFFNEQVNTHCLHYATCYGGGNHTILPFQHREKTYNYAIICACLTDCHSYCKWDNCLPSSGKRFLVTTDLGYNKVTKEWQLLAKSPYNWDLFFNKLVSIDFASDFTEHLLPALRAVTLDSLEDMSMLRLPHCRAFYPVYEQGFSKISDHMLSLAAKEKNSITIYQPHFILVDSTIILPEIVINNAGLQKTHIISIKPGDATHYFKKISAKSFLDIVTTFWQTEGQWYDKIFLIDELSCPANFDILVRKFNYPSTERNLVLNNVLIQVSKDHLIRIFFSIQNKSVMLIANNPNTIQALVQLNEKATQSYQAYYKVLVKRILKIAPF